MQKRQIPVGILGMNQDVRSAQINTKQAYEIKNLRLNSTKDGNSLELTSERGTRFVLISGSIPGDIIGYAIIGDYIVVFSTGTVNNVKQDYITRLKPRTSRDTGNYDLKAEVLFAKDIGFNINNKIETIVSYENEDVQKVYWIDGINLTRVINVAGDANEILLKYNTEDPFSFAQVISEYPAISVNKINSGGLFYAGVIQYAVSYYKKNAQETPILYTTPLNYISHIDRGEQPEKQLGCSFDITIISRENEFDYIRVYSIYRTSLNAQPLVKIVRNIEIDKSYGPHSYTFVDTNEFGYDFDAYRLLIPQTPIVPQTFTHKDSKLFEGNYRFNTNELDWLLFINDNAIEWTGSKTIELHNSNESSFYPYVNQLQNKSDDIQIFKQYEYYKLGILFQDKYGNWTTPMLIATTLNNGAITMNQDGSVATVALPRYTLTIGDIKLILEDENKLDDYINVRPIVSYPTKSERSVLCLGVVSPTVFECSRYNSNSKTTQSSWFFRPIYNNLTIDDDESLGFVENRHWHPLYGSDKHNGELLNMYFNKPFVSVYQTEQDWIHGVTVNGVDYPPFGDNDVTYNTSTEQYTYLGYTVTRVEKQNYRYVLLYMDGNTLTSKVYDSKYSDIFTRTSQIFNDNLNQHYYYNGFYFVNYNNITINSPELDFDTFITNVDLSQYNIRRTGYVEFKTVASRYNIIATRPLFINSQEYKENGHSYYIRSANLPFGFYDKLYTSINQNGKLLSVSTCWFDDVNYLFTYYDFVHDWNKLLRQFAFAVYPWQRQYLGNWSNTTSFEHGDNDSDNIDITKENESGKIISKVLSNLRWCNTTYFNTNTNSDIYSDVIKLYDSTEHLLILLKENNYYYGNVDDVITTTSDYFGFRHLRLHNSPYNESTHDWIFDAIPGYPIIRNGWMYSGTEDEDLYNGILRNIESHDYAILKAQDDKLRPLSGYKLYGELDAYPGDISDGYVSGDIVIHDGHPMEYCPTPIISSTDPILMRYKSSPHLVCNVPGASDVDFRVQDIGNNIGYCILVDVYKDISNSPYVTDKSYSTLMSRTWVPCGESVSLYDDNENDHLVWLSGDTYLQRYDCLKTYPFSKDDYQSVVEIASFPVETHINIDGRYDNNRGLSNNTFITNENFNLLNPVYSQIDNFFNYNITKYDDITNNFPNTIVWSLDKQNGADIDEWTRINTTSSMDLDGDKGSLTKLVRWRNQIFALQQHAISRIKYNENVALTTNKGVPIELSNSLSVNGKEYLNDIYGTQNKWTVGVAHDGIYFVDYHTPGIYHIGADLYGNVGVTNIAKNVMLSWVEQHTITQTSYDNNMGELLFQYYKNNDNLKTIQGSLAYLDGVFTSLYDYKGFIDNYMNHTISITNNNVLWYLREGDTFNNLYSNTPSEYYVLFIANPTFDGGIVANDCIFDNIEYKGDVFKTNNTFIEDTANINYPFHDTQTGTWYESFNRVDVENSYQTSTSTSGFIKKFRTWRVPIPRQTDSRARMRDNWIKIKLSNTSPSAYKFVLRDIFVDAFY